MPRPTYSDPRVRLLDLDLLLNKYVQDGSDTEDLQHCPSREAQLDIPTPSI